MAEGVYLSEERMARIWREKLRRMKQFSLLYIIPAEEGE